MKKTAILFLAALAITQSGTSRLTSSSSSAS